jgi:hypothetical protein
MVAEKQKNEIDVLDGNSHLVEMYARGLYGAPCSWGGGDDYDTKKFLPLRVITTGYDGGFSIRTSFSPDEKQNYHKTKIIFYDNTSDKTRKELTYIARKKGLFITDVENIIKKSKKLVLEEFA